MTGQSGLVPVEKVSHEWSKEALLAKAQRYVEEMLAQPRENWQFAFLSTLALEFLARATLAHISPALLADPKEWNNLYFSLGFKPTASQFVPKSIDISAVFKRLREVLPSFDVTLENFATSHMAKRNKELHSGATPFDGNVLSTWLPLFYWTSEVLLASMGESLEVLCGTAEAQTASAMIAAAKDTSAKAVGRAISIHADSWQSLPDKERQDASAQASLWAARHVGHRVTCPACGSMAIVTGEAMAPPTTVLNEGEITETQYHLPSRFECIACKLRITGLAPLYVVGLAEPYKVTRAFDAAEYYAPPSEDLEYWGYEEDNNEP